jgi:hypothetical protein
MNVPGTETNARGPFAATQEPLPPAQRGQNMTEVVELFEKVNMYQETQRPEVDMEKV